jgi:hypothetical protein
MIYAKRFNYDPLQLPGITEAAEAADWRTARAQASILQAALRLNAALLRSITSGLTPPATAR